jgi:hypothetical protein
LTSFWTHRNFPASTNYTAILPFIHSKKIYNHEICGRFERLIDGERMSEVKKELRRRERII